MRHFSGRVWLLSLGLLPIYTTSSVTVVRAISSDSVSNAVGTEVLQSKIEVRKTSEATPSVRCEKYHTRRDERLQSQESRIAAHISTYTQMRIKVDNLLTILQAQGVDTSGITLPLQHFREAVEAVSDARSRYLQQAKELDPCVAGANVTKVLGQSTTAWHQIQTEVRQAREVYQNSLRPALIALKLSIKDSQVSPLPSLGTNEN